jgi:acyl-CoA dehydrogenase
LKHLFEHVPEAMTTEAMDFLLYLGEMSTLVAYGQLIIEKYNMNQFEEDLL